MERSPHSFCLYFGLKVTVLSLQINSVLSISYLAKHFRPLLSYSGSPAKAAGKSRGTYHCLGVCSSWVTGFTSGRPSEAEDFGWLWCVRESRAR